MKRILTIAALAILLVSSAALADTLKVTSVTSFASPSGAPPLESSNTYSFKGPQTITFTVAGKTCNLNGSARGPVPMGCNYAITVEPNGSISGTLTAGNQYCTQSNQIASSCQ
ncbi:MAG TPA: hypothetical protein VJ725_06525 [Thermoanaerobaculia bacterium]|nr:hypothetical protein [Thermoanaerobaculia bacterium]